MEELRGAYEQTKKIQENLDALDVRPGEVGGMREESEPSTSRALLETKQRKTKIAPEGDRDRSSTTPLVMSLASDPFEKPLSRMPGVSEARI